MWVENKPETHHVKSVCFSCSFVRGASSTNSHLFSVLVTINNSMRGRFALHCVEGPVNHDNENGVDRVVHFDLKHIHFCLDIKVLNRKPNEEKPVKIMELNKYPILGFSAKISAIMKQVKHK